LVDDNPDLVVNWSVVSADERSWKLDPKVIKELVENRPDVVGAGIPE
jgi:hypothetical protein